MKLKSLLMCGLAMAALATSVQAQEITVSGFTSGTFSAGTPPSLTFAGTNFSNTTFRGEAFFSNLGTFNLAATEASFDNFTFQLRVTFTSPPGTGPNPATFGGILEGQVSSTGTGGVRIDFLNNRENPLLFTFANGSFQFFVDDVSIQPNIPSTLTGGVMSAQVQVPEGGSTVALLGMAMVGAAALRRKFGRA